MVNAIEAPLSKYIHVGAILSKEIQSVLHRLSGNIHGGFVKSKLNKESNNKVRFVRAVSSETAVSRRSAADL